MSLEDLDSDCQSDESDYDDEVGKKPVVVEDDDEDYMELVRLHAQLTLFDHIYHNNIEIDTLCLEIADWSSSDHYSGDSELDLIQDFVDSVFEDVVSVDTPVSSPVTSHGDTSNPDTDDDSLSSSLDSFCTSSSSSSDWLTISDDSDDVDEQTTDADDANSLQDGAVCGQQ